jgi:hypothetical protein
MLLGAATYNVLKDWDVQIIITNLQAGDSKRWNFVQAISIWWNLPSMPQNGSV